MEFIHYNSIQLFIIIYYSPRRKTAHKSGKFINPLMGHL